MAIEWVLGCVNYRLSAGCKFTQPMEQDLLVRLRVDHEEGRVPVGRFRVEVDPRMVAPSDPHDVRRVRVPRELTGTEVVRHGAQLSEVHVLHLERCCNVVCSGLSWVGFISCLFYIHKVPLHCSKADSQGNSSL